MWIGGYLSGNGSESSARNASLACRLDERRCNTGYICAHRLIADLEYPAKTTPMGTIHR